MITSKKNETTATTPTTTPEPKSSPDGKSKFPASNTDFPTPGSTGSDDSGTSTTK